MGTIFDYLDWWGDIPFAQVPLNPVDALILSTLAYVHFQDLVPQRPGPGVPLAQAAQAFLSLPESSTEDRVRCDNDRKLLRALMDAPRFSGLTLTFHQDIFSPQRETQFAALAIRVSQAETFLAFRGTDSTLVGWKEDFNMSFLDTVPAQQAALDYLTAWVAHSPGPVILGGHSKGGNLAVYAAALASPTVRDRVKAVYNNDGPGFTKKVLTAPGYLELIPRIHSFVPQSSVVGMLLEHEDPYTVIKSRQLGIFQHDPYSWEVQGGGFVVVDQVTQGSRKLDQTVKSWLDALTPTDREVFLDGLYQALAGTQARSLDDLAQPKNLYTVFQGLTRLDEGTRTSIARTLGLLAKSAAGVLLDDDS